MIKLPVQLYKISVLISLLFFKTNGKAQLLDSLTLDTLTAYTNLQEALKQPDKVIKLVLRKQHLKEFPKEIAQFNNLQYLDLSKNAIKEIPDEIGQLTQLQYFICNKNNLATLSKETGKLVNLLYLNLNQNDLEYLPPQIGNLEKLKYFDLWDNNFSEYPSTLANLKSLRVLDLRHILINEERQTNIKNMLPHATVYMDNPCQCKW